MEAPQSWELRYLMHPEYLQIVQGRGVELGQVLNIDFACFRWLKFLFARLGGVLAHWTLGSPCACSAGSARAIARGILSPSSGLLLVAVEETLEPREVLHQRIFVGVGERDLLKKGREELH